RKAIEMAVFARLNDGATRPADRIRYKRPIEPHPFLRDSVDIRRFVAAAVVSTDRLIGVIIGKDEEDIRAIIGSQGNRIESNKGGADKKKQAAHSTNRHVERGIEASLVA